MARTKVVAQSPETVVVLGARGRLLPDGRNGFPTSDIRHLSRNFNPARLSTSPKWHFTSRKITESAVSLRRRQSTRAQLVECDGESSDREQIAALRSELLRIPGADIG